MTSPMTPHLEKIARAIGERILADAQREGDFVTRIGPKLDGETEAEIPGAPLVIAVDGEVDLTALARAALSALLPPSEEMDQRALNVAWETFKLHDPKVNHVEMRATLAHAIRAYVQSILTEGEGA